MTQNDENSLMGPTDVAQFLGVPVATIYQWRHKGTGPKSLKVGRHLRYRRSDLEAWLDAQADSVV